MISLITLKVYLISAWFAFLALAERIWPATEGPIFSPRQLKNLALWVINSAISPLIVLPLVAWAQSVHMWLRPMGGWWFLFDLVILDVTLYWWHRLNHEVPFLWRFHVVHHLDAQLDTTTAVRFHFGEVFLSALFRLPIIILFSIPFTSVVIFEILVMVASLFHHSNLRLPVMFEIAIRPYIITPDVHWLHHHPPRLDTNSNYGTFFSFWDHAFKSWNGKYRYKDMPLGVEGLEEKSMRQLLSYPFVKAKK